MLAIADQRGEFGFEMPRNLGRIGEPLIFIRLEPAQTVADNHASARDMRPVPARAMERRAEEYQGAAGVDLGGDRILDRAVGARRPWLPGQTSVAPLASR